MFWGGWSLYATIANLKLSPSVLTLFSMLWTIDSIVDLTWVIYLDIEPVASTQKHTSIELKDEIAKLSLELDFNFTTFLAGGLGALLVEAFLFVDEADLIDVLHLGLEATFPVFLGDFLLVAFVGFLGTFLP